MDSNILRPSDLLALAKSGGMKPQSPVAYDTETSGLHTDDGARTSTVSVAWEDTTGEWMDFLKGRSLEDRVTWGLEEFAPGEQAMIVSLAWPFDQGVSGKPEDTGQEMLWPEADNLDLEEWVALLEWLWLCGQEQGLICHNAKFDVWMMHAGCRRFPGVGKDFQSVIHWDTQTGNNFLYPLHPTSLKPTAARLWGADQTDESEAVKAYLKKKKLPAGRWDLIPWDILGPYADKDARMTICLYLRQIWDIENFYAGQHLVDNDAMGAGDAEGALAPVYAALHRRFAVTWVLFRMEMRGLPYDEAQSRMAAQICAERAAELEPRLPFRATINSAKDYFFSDGTTDKGVECLGMVPYSVTDKGAPQLTAETLTRMIDDEIPHAKTWGEYNKALNAASMWYDGYADAMGTDGRLRTNFRQNGTRSTRFSVERVNLQAIPQDYRLSDHTILAGIPTPRDLIKAEVEKMDGWTMYELDLEQAELRVGAMFAGCVKMLEMISNGEDLHTYTTEALFPHIDPADPSFKSKWRQVGKRGNFSLQFGSGANTFKAMVSKETGIVLDEYEAKRIVRDWNALYPEYGRAIVKHQRVVERRQSRHNHAWVSAVNGERRWFQAYEEAHKAFNQRVQTNLAQFAMSWMLESDAYLRAQGLDDTPIGGAGLILTVHDSQMLLLPSGPEGAKMAAECASFGEQLWKEWFPGVPGGVEWK